MDGDWYYVEDNRGPAWSKHNGAYAPILELGPFPDDRTRITPPAEFPRWDETCDNWIIDVEAMRDARLAAINAECKRRTYLIRADVPADEVTSWTKQETEARQLVVDDSATAPFLRTLADARGIPLDVLARKVIEKADVAARNAARVIGTRQALEDRLSNIDMATPDAATQISAITWPNDL
ncbi:MAG: hypothetical protein QM803_00935 [Rhodocyclaceae bacterium]